MPQASLAALVLLFGVYALVDGALAVATAIAAPGGSEQRWLVALWGLVGIGAGVITFLAPDVTALALLFYIAIWAVATGVLQIAAAIRLRREIEGEWILGLAGLASVVFGVVLVAKPGAGALAVLWIIATYAVVFGILLVILAFKARGLLQEAEGTK
jgi:uncharacterized membrane protein HdeD (DUF308 family)